MTTKPLGTRLRQVGVGLGVLLLAFLTSLGLFYAFGVTRTLIGLGVLTVVAAFVRWAYRGAKRREAEAIAGDKRIRDQLAERRKVAQWNQSERDRVARRVHRATDGAA